MKLVTCRDCGEAVDLDSRGCPRCARNLDAERALGKFLCWAGALCAAAAVVIAAYLTLGRG